MAKERLKSPRARLFVALDLPEDTRSAIVGWQREALEDAALRPVRAEALHMTLAFLGYHPERRIDEIGALATEIEAASGPVPVELEPEPVPRPARSPRLFALRARSERAVAIQAEVAERLASAGFYEPEKRPFRPHVTVARVRPEKGRLRRPRHVDAPPGPLPASIERVFYAVRLTLYLSKLQRQGAEYVPLAHKELPAGSSEVI